MRSEPKRGGLGVAIGLALGLAALLPARPALAFCRTSSCGEAGTGQNCTPAQGGDCGISLFWSSPCVGYSIQKGASSKVSFETTQKIMQASFAAWEAASCLGGTPRIVATEAAAAECTKHEYNQEHGNANIIVFRDDGWPYEGSSNTLALTTVTYNLDTGEIYDADMEINSADNAITTSDSPILFDLQSITTHEAGHFLGLAHSATLAATMFPDYKVGKADLRTLDPDDTSAICAVYPVGLPIPASCDPTPRHGFSTLCGADQTGASGTTSGSGSGSGSDSATGCGCRVGGGSGPLSTAGLAAVLAAIGIAARRRPKRDRRGASSR